MATVSNSTVTFVELKHSLVPKKWEEAVRLVNMSECNEVARSLAYAFATDDLACYLLNSDDMASLTPEDKWKLHVDIFNYIVAAHVLNGEVHVIGPEYEGVALWMPPGEFRCRFYHSSFVLLTPFCRQEHGRLVDASPVWHVEALLPAFH